MFALLMSVVLASIGFTIGLPLWNNGWSLDIVDLAGIPLALWVIYRVFKR